MATNLAFASSSQTLLNLVNEERVRNGIQALKLDPRLIKCAQLHSEYQAEIHTMTHDDPGGDVGTRILDEGFNYYYVGENIGAQTSNPYEIMDAWMDSSHHRANILKQEFTHFGSAMVDDYWTQIFATSSNYDYGD
ncbi:hypothetical protein G9A89_009419 [Geosiphon pyriformis]|nr:hypothetical protein G9A89_009419 [Geosiphon pyriformis]